MKETFLGRFQEIRNSIATLVFVYKPLSADVTKLNFSLIKIDFGAFEKQLLKLKTKSYGTPKLMLIWKI